MIVSAFAQLREQVDAQDRQRATERAKLEEAERQNFLNEVIKALGADVAEELDPELDPQYMKVILHYRGHSWHVERRDIERLMAQVLPARIAKWASEMDEKIATFEVEQEEIRAELPEIIAGCESLFTLNHQREEAERYNLLDDPDVKAALDARQIVLERAVADAEAKEQAAEQAELQELIAKANAAADPIDLHDLRYHRLRGRPEARAAITAAKEHVKQAEDERKAKWEEAEQAAFYPFRVYRVHYGIVATDEDYGTYADTHSIYSATIEPDTGRFYHPLESTAHVMLNHVVKIEKLTVDTVATMRNMYIGQTEDTEWGIIRIPPPECERLPPAPATDAGGRDSGGAGEE